jgi:hypothetical protein
MSDNLPPGAVPATEEDRIKLLQAIYHTLTGKTEKLSRSFSGNYRIEMDDIKQLDAKMHQTATQWHCVSKNDNVQVTHLDDSKQQFSSVERFLTYDASITSPVETVNFEFNVLISLPGVEKPQPYKVTLRILSRIAMLRSLTREFVPSSMLRFFRNSNIVAEVEYVDYNVARTLISALESWVDQIHVERTSVITKFIQSRSHWLPRLARLGIIIGGTMAIVSLAPRFVLSGAGLQSLAQFAAGAFGFLLAWHLIAGWIGRFGEESIDSIIDVSYVNFNRGDARLIKEFNRRNVYARAKSIVSIPILGIQALLSERVAGWILAFFGVG